MTRQEWIDSIGDFGDLVHFCLDSGYQEDEANQILSDYDLDNYVEDDIRSYDCGWQSLRDYLNEIPSGYDWYRCNGYFDYDGLTNDEFEDWKADVLSELDRDGYFDDDEEEDDDDGVIERVRPEVEYRSQEMPKWMCCATRGDDSIPVFDTNSVGLDALLGGDAMGRSA